MGKVVRAFSLDQAVSEDLDYHTTVPGKMKPMNKSKYVNEALKFYMGKNISALIGENKDLKGFLGSATNNLADARRTIGGLEQQLAVSHQCEIDKMEEIARLRESSDCRCLWCRLKRRLQKSQAEQ